jgi:hypothetical protein
MFDSFAGRQFCTKTCVLNPQRLVVLLKQATLGPQLSHGIGDHDIGKRLALAADDGKKVSHKEAEGGLDNPKPPLLNLLV